MAMLHNHQAKRIHSRASHCARRCPRRPPDNSRYAYDAWGNRAEAKLPDQSRIRYAYDGLHRLVRLTLPEAEVRYRYDAFGRRLAKSVLRQGQTQTTWFGWDGDRLTRIEDEATTRETVYEPASFVPLLMLEKPKGGPSAIEALLGATLLPGSEEAIQTQAMLAALPQDFDTTPAQQALQATRATLERDTPPTRIRYFHCDHLGTPMALSDEEGKIVWQARFDPWGNLIEEQSDDGIVQPFRFQGQFFDEESGLHYNRYRYYDPKLGTYVTQDPIGIVGGVNKYGYVRGNPVSAIDPTGLLEILDRNGISFQAYPKGDGSNESALMGPHGDYHFHLNGEKDKVVVVDRDGNLIPENPNSLTKKEKKVLEELSEDERRYLRKACREVFHNNAPRALPRLKLRYLSGALGSLLAPLMSNSYEEVCAKDLKGDLDDVCR